MRHVQIVVSTDVRDGMQSRMSIFTHIHSFSISTRPLEYCQLATMTLSNRSTSYCVFVTRLKKGNQHCSTTDGAHFQTLALSAPDFLPS